MTGINATVSVGSTNFGNGRPLCLIAGPCQMESRTHALETAQALKEMAGTLGIGLVYSVTTGVSQVIAAVFRNPAVPRANPSVNASVRIGTS